MPRHPSDQFRHQAQAWRRVMRAAGWGPRVSRYLGPCGSGLLWVAPIALTPRLAAWFEASGFEVSAELGIAHREV